jgi:hypothetical protein
MLRLFVSGKIEVVNTKKKRKEVQIKSIPDPTAYLKNTVGKRRPDAVFYESVDKVGVVAITMVGEVKSGGNGEFPVEFAGQLTDGMTRLMKKQPFRHKMIGFLTDGCRFLFVECLLCDSKLQFSHSVIFTGCAGWQVGFVVLKPSLDQQ